MNAFTGNNKLSPLGCLEQLQLFLLPIPVTWSYSKLLSHCKILILTLLFTCLFSRQENQAGKRKKKKTASGKSRSQKSQFQTPWRILKGQHHYLQQVKTAKIRHLQQLGNNWHRTFPSLGQFSGSSSQLHPWRIKPWLWNASPAFLSISH